MIFNRIHIASFILLLACLFQPIAVAEGLDEKIQKKMLLFDFQRTGEVMDWRIVNDGVMGGLSQSEIVLSDNHTAIFRGTVSLDNNGGFASTRTRLQFHDLDSYDGIVFRLKGDGKKYQFRLRTDDRFDGISYRYMFKTEPDKWIVIEVPFDACVPVFRGRVLANVEAVNPKNIKQIGFLIAGKQSGPFKIEFDWIKAYKK